ncbi:hypothetical protein HRI96_06220 [Treponema parvum]|uniref:Response regulatory domain-containing protein n=1 Tax=Treponema parvum TaxID=138851 RepID=A0A975F038_9SPIR|nr:hypothetical protein [Treponema parvum]QTQ11830.1 hypothetical protein HRI96_06220 [Treponema parvum]
MKALIIADDPIAVERFSAVFKTAGYDVIVYRWLVKAIDNIEEISPHIILVSAVEYPRHWKTVTQYAKSGISATAPQVILYTGKDFSEEEQKKASQLGVRGFFSSYDVDGLDKLREILKKENDIYEGSLSVSDDRSSGQAKDAAVPTDRLSAPSAASSSGADKGCATVGNKTNFIFTDPATKAFITGKVVSFDGEIMTFQPDNHDKKFDKDQKISDATLKFNDQISSVSAFIIENDKILKLKLVAV